MAEQIPVATLNLIDLQDSAINALEGITAADQLQIQRLKKRKLV